MASNISTPALTPTPTPGPRESSSSSTAPATPTPTKTLHIRPATVDDAEQISRLGTDVFTTTFRDSGCTPEQLQKYLEESYSVEAIRDDLQDPHKTTLVSVDPAPAHPKSCSSSSSSLGRPPKTDESTKITGFALLNRASSDAEPAIAGHYAQAVELQRLYVDGASHGRGIGQALMNEAERLARAEGWVHMWLGVWESNFRAQKIYGKLGFQRVGEHLFDVGGDPQWDWILVKKL